MHLKGSYCTVKDTVVLWLKLPLVPLMVSTFVPTAVLR